MGDGGVQRYLVRLSLRFSPWVGGVLSWNGCGAW